MTSVAGTSRIERRKAELRSEIIDAAFDCFAENGYHATGIADIAARLGIGHGTFYRYFENKRDIVEHVVDEVVTKIVGALGSENAADLATSFEEYAAQAERIGDALGRIMLDDPRLPRLVFEAPGIDPEMSNRVLSFLDLASQLNTEYMAHGVEVGYLRADLDVEATATAINGMILASMLSAVRGPDPDQYKRLSLAIRRLMFEGITS